MAIKFEHRFYDYEQNHFKVEIYRPGESDTLYYIQKSGADPVAIRHSGGGKNSMEDTVIQGKELEFSFFLPRADIAHIDDIFESQYQDYVLKYTNIDTSEVLFTGYVKPENLTKRYETNPPYIEINLPANDGLADLAEFDFRDSSDALILGRYAIIDIIKKALNPIAGSVLNFDFKVQLGTYEKDSMTATQCALKEIYVDALSFLNGEVKDDDPLSCSDVITDVLKGYNVVMCQEGENWIIKNPHELDSYEFTYDWATLTQQSRTATNYILDISDDKCKPFIEEQKVHPLRYASIVQTYDVRGAEYLTGEWTEWTITNFTDYTIDPDVDNKDNVVLLEQAAQSVSSDISILPQLNVSVTLPKVSNTDYLIFSFDYEIKKFTAALSVPGGPCKLYIRVEVQKPNGDWTAPVYSEIDLRVRNKEVTFELPNKIFPIEEAGIYAIKVSFEVKRAFYQGMEIYFRNPSVQINASANYNRRTTSDSGRGGRSSSSERDVIYGRRAGRSGTVSRERIPTPKDSGEDKKWRLEQPNGYEKFEVNLAFGDVVTAIGQEVRAPEANLISIFYDSADNMTRSWNSYGNTENKPIVYIYAKNVVNNRQRYKNYIRTRVYDRNHLIYLTNILLIEGKHYFISEYDRYYKEGYVELGLIELVTDQLTFTDGLQEEKLKNQSAPTIVDENPLVTDGIDQEAHGLAVGDVVRYDFATKKYVKALADTPENARAIGIVSEVMDADRFNYLSDDYVRSDSQLYATLKSALALEEGEYYFVSPTESGKVLKSAELQPDDIEQCVGYVTTKGLKIEVDAKNIQPPGKDPYIPRAASQILAVGNNTINYSYEFPSGSTVIVWIYTYDTNGFQVGHTLVSEPDETGFIINVPIVCTLKYIATLAN